MSEPMVLLMGWGFPSRRGGMRAGCGSATGSTGRSWPPIWTAGGRHAYPGPGQPSDGVLHRLAARRQAAVDRRQGPAPRTRRVDGRARRAASERDRRGRARQRLRQRRGLRLRCRRATQAGLHQAGHARGAATPGRRGHPVPQRHGHHPGRPDADHFRVVRRRSPRSTSPPTAGCRDAGSSPRSRAGRHLLDADGAVWVQTSRFSVVRVADGGTVLQRVELAAGRAPFALMLGGPDRRTLFICTAEWDQGEAPRPTSNGWPRDRAPGRSWPSRSRCLGSGRP